MTTRLSAEELAAWITNEGPTYAEILEQLRVALGASRPAAAPASRAEVEGLLTQYRAAVVAHVHCSGEGRCEKHAIPEEEALANLLRAWPVRPTRAEVERTRQAFLNALWGQRESFEQTRPLCSGHVDKMSGDCLGCPVPAPSEEKGGDEGAKP